MSQAFNVLNLPRSNVKETTHRSRIEDMGESRDAVVSPGVPIHADVRPDATKTRK